MSRHQLVIVHHVKFHLRRKTFKTITKIGKHFRKNYNMHMERLLRFRRQSPNLAIKSSSSPRKKQQQAMLKDKDAALSIRDTMKKRTSR